MPSVVMLLRLAGILLGAAAIALSLVDPDVVTRRSGGGGEERAGAATEVALLVATAPSDPARAATLGR